MHQLQRDGLVDHRAHPVADIAAQTEEIETVLLVDQHREAHARLTDLAQPAIERTRRARCHTGNVLTHLARNPACFEVRGAGGHAVAEYRQLERVVGTVAHAQAATHTGGQKIGFGQRAGRTNRRGRQRRSLSGIQTGPEREQTRPTCHAGRILEEAAT